MLKIIIIVTCFIVSFCTSASVSAQDSLNVWYHTTHLKLVQIDQGNSYITTPFDIGNIEDLKFEFNSNPSFILRENDKAHLMMVFTPQIILRLYNTRSYPIKTPSYMPHVTLYYSIGNSSTRKMHSIFFQYAHHSNGQKDSTIFYDGRINLESGDFSTNYFKLGAVRALYYTPLKSILFLESDFEYHMKSFTNPHILGKYGMYRWNNRLSILNPPSYFHKNGDFQFDTRINWMFGNINDWNAFYYKRLGVELTLFYSPSFLEELGFFVKFYSGMDYYNIYFDHYLYILRFGIMSHFLRF